MFVELGQPIQLFKSENLVLFAKMKLTIRLAGTSLAAIISFSRRIVSLPRQPERIFLRHGLRGIWKRITIRRCGTNMIILSLYCFLYTAALYHGLPAFLAYDFQTL
jgi:hypothetical protein